MKLRNKRFWIFEGTIMSTVLIFGIIYFSCGFSELIGASIYGVFSFTHLIAGTATWIVCKIDYWANLAIWQIEFSSAFSLLLVLLLMQGKYDLLSIISLLGINLLSLLICPVYCIIYATIIKKCKTMGN